MTTFGTITLALILLNAAMALGWLLLFALDKRLAMQFREWMLHEVD